METEPTCSGVRAEFLDEAKGAKTSSIRRSRHPRGNHDAGEHQEPDPQHLQGVLSDVLSHKKMRIAFCCNTRHDKGEFQVEYEPEHTIKLVKHAIEAADGVPPNRG